MVRQVDRGKYTGRHGLVPGLSQSPSSSLQTTSLSPIQVSAHPTKPLRLWVRASLSCKAVHSLLPSSLASLGATGNPTRLPPSSYSVNKHSLDRPRSSKTAKEKREPWAVKTQTWVCNGRFSVHSETWGVNLLTSRREKKHPKRKISTLPSEGERGTRGKGPGNKGSCISSFFGLGKICVNLAMPQGALQSTTFLAERKKKISGLIERCPERAKRRMLKRLLSAFPER